MDANDEDVKPATTALARTSSPANLPASSPSNLPGKNPAADTKVKGKKRKSEAADKQPKAAGEEGYIMLVNLHFQCVFGFTSSPWPSRVESGGPGYDRGLNLSLWLSVCLCLCVCLYLCLCLHNRTPTKKKKKSGGTKKPGAGDKKTVSCPG